MPVKVLKPNDPALEPVHQGDKTVAPSWTERLAASIGNEDPIGPDIRKTLTSPLAHPTGYDAIDGFTSPLNLAMMAGGAVKPLAGLAVKAGAAAADTIAPEVVGVMSPRLANLMKLAQRVRDAMTSAAPAAAGGLSAADKALLARQGYSPELIQRAEQQLIRARATPQGPSATPSTAPKWPIAPEEAPGSRIVPETGETEAAWRARVASKIQGGGASSAGGSTPAQSTGTSFQPAPMPQRPPMTVSPSSPMQPPAGKAATLADTGGASDQLGSLLDAIHGPNAPPNGNGLLKAPSPIRSIEGRPAPLYPSAGTVKGVTSNALEAASNQALAAGHWDEAERLIGQSLQSFFQGSGGPMAGILAAAIAHKARQVVEPLRADPSFQQATPAKQQQMIQQALRQPGARGSLTSLLGS